MTGNWNTVCVSSKGDKGIHENLQGFSNIFSKRATGFQNISLDGQTRQAKLSSQLVNMPGS